MSKYKKGILLLIVTILINIIIALIFSIYVFAMDSSVSSNVNGNDDEIIKLNAGIYIDEEEVIHTPEEIYYANNEVDIILNHDETNREDKEVETILNELKEQNISDEFKIVKDEFYRMSEYDGEKFSEYKDMQEAKYTIGPNESDEYNRNVFKFRRILSYKIFRVSANNAESEADIEKSDLIEYLKEYTFESPVYQIIFDKKSPLISVKRSDESDGSQLDISTGIDMGNVSVGQKVMININDATGLKTVNISRNDSSIDTISLLGEERIIEYNYELILEKENSEIDEIGIIAEDLAGNISEYYFDYSIDSSPPVLSVLGANDGGIYGSVMLTVNAVDNSETANIYYKCQYTNQDGQSTILENLTSNGVNNFSRSYTKQGVYDIIAFAYDMSGNYSDTIRLSFGVDVEAPQIKIENINNNGLYNSDVNLYAVLSELFYDSANVAAECYITDEYGERNLSLSPFEIGARVNKNIYSFSEEGSYKIRFKATDKLGHENNAEVHFTIDKSAPEIRVSADEDMQRIYNYSPSVRVKTLDIFTEYETLMTLIRKNKDGSYSLEDSSRIVSIGKNTEFSVPVSGEGEYTLKIVSRDDAGNISERNIEFTVDKTPPTIGFISDFNEKFIKSFTLPSSLSNYIDDMTGVSYWTYLNSKNVSLCEITKDGKYILQIVAVDDAGNVSEETAAFIVDATEPKIIVKGVDSNGEVTLNDSIELSLFDRDDYFKYVLINGKQVSLPYDRNVLCIPVNQYGEYNIEACASDFAGNETRRVIKTNCVFKANPFEMTINSSDIKTLTKNEEEIREKFFWGVGDKKSLLLWGIVGVIATLSGIFLLVDIKNLKCDTMEKD